MVMFTRRTGRWDLHVIRHDANSPHCAPLPHCPCPSYGRSKPARSRSRFRPTDSSSLRSQRCRRTGSSRHGETRASRRLEVRMRDMGWAIVTGASGGMGAAFTRALAQRGHRVLAVARSAERIARVAADVKKNGGLVETLAVDLASAAGVAAVVDRARALGDIELLVNNAGLSTSGHFLQQSPEREIESIHVNVEERDRKSTRLNSSHLVISYA